MDSLIAQQLLQAEQDVARMAEQAAQEEAMAEVLPRRFAANIAAFSAHMPAIAAQFQDYQPTRSFEFFCTDNGIPNLRWCDDGSTFYGVDPFHYCSEQIDSVLRENSLDRGGNARKAEIEGSFNALHLTLMNKFLDVDRDLASRLVIQKESLKSIPLMMCFGGGLGYHLSYLYERCEVHNLFLFEPNLDVFYASLFCFDWASLLSYLEDQQKGLHLFIGQNENDIINDIQSVIGRYGIYQVASCVGFWHYSSPSVNLLRDTVENQFQQIVMAWGFFDDNLYALSHGAQNIKVGLPFLRHKAQISDKYSQLPVFVVGNGPSLDASLSYLQRYQNHVLIIACGSAISALHRVGIKPDIYVAVERVQAMADFLTVINDPDYLRDILFLSVDVIHPDHQQIFERIGLCLKGDEMLTALFKAKRPDLLYKHRALRGMNPLVGNMGLTTSLALGFRQIYLIGIDNGYRDSRHHHSKESAYFDDHGQPITELIYNKSDNLRVTGNFGGKVISNKFYADSAFVMGTVLAVFPDARCYNCADGAAIKGALPLALSDIIVSESVEINKKALLDEIHGLYSPLEFDLEQLENALDCDGYNDFVDKLIGHWDIIPESRSALVAKIQEQYEYIRGQGPAQAMYVKMLVGSMYHIFTLMTRILHRYEDESRIIPEMKAVYKILHDFLIDSKDIYAKSLDWVDNNKMNHTELYRKGR
ncbi:MAG: motility associated factor glycosyltransferase family protein [Shewanella sp.]